MAMINVTTLLKKYERQRTNPFRKVFLYNATNSCSRNSQIGLKILKMS